MVWIFGKKKEKKKQKFEDVEMEDFLSEHEKKVMRAQAKIEDSFTSVQITEQLLEKFKELQQKYFDDLSQLEQKYKQRMQEYEQQINMLKAENEALRQQYMKALEALGIELKRIVDKLDKAITEKSTEKKTTWW